MDEAQLSALKYLDTRLGAIHSSSVPNLVALGQTTAAAMKLLTKLSRHAVHAAQAIVRKKELEQELLSLPPQARAENTRASLFLPLFLPP